MKFNMMILTAVITTVTAGSTFAAPPPGKPGSGTARPSEAANGHSGARAPGVPEPATAAGREEARRGSKPVDEAREAREREARELVKGVEEAASRLNIPEADVRNFRDKLLSRELLEAEPKSERGQEADAIRRSARALGELGRETTLPDRTGVETSARTLTTMARNPTKYKGPMTAFARNLVAAAKEGWLPNLQRAYEAGLEKMNDGTARTPAEIDALFLAEIQLEAKNKKNLTWEDLMTCGHA